MISHLLRTTSGLITNQRLSSKAGSMAVFLANAIAAREYLKHGYRWSYELPPELQESHEETRELIITEADIDNSFGDRTDLL